MGLENGYALMVGGDDDNVKRLMPIFETLKPEGSTASSTPARSVRATT